MLKSETFRQHPMCPDAGHQWIFSYQNSCLILQNSLNLPVEADEAKTEIFLLFTHKCISCSPHKGESDSINSFPKRLGIPFIIFGIFVTATISYQFRDIPCYKFVQTYHLIWNVVVFEFFSRDCL